MQALHIHLILSHAPTVIILLGSGLLVVGVLRRSEDLKRGALGVFVSAALVAFPVYLTGEPSADSVKGLPAISDRVLDQHQAVAALALASGVLLGILSGVGFFLFRGAKAVAGWFTAILLGASLLAGGFLGWTANLGGQIRHSEIRSDEIK
jgi:hypothetical protein